MRVIRWSFRALLLAAALGITVTVCLVSCMPGRSFREPLPQLTDAQRALSAELRHDVGVLATEIGERCLANPENLAAAATYIEGEFRSAGYAVERQTYDVAGHECANLVVELPGTTRPDEILVVGAHYDSARGCPAANDNGSAVAALLALARRIADQKPARTVRFVAFANEEPPHFWTENMGSLVYARRCRARNEDIVGMLALETMGYYSDQRGSQHYPPPFSLLYPSTGNFIAFVGNLDSRRFIRRVVGSFRQHALFPSEGAALPGFVREAGFSDHWSFWQMGYPALMVTDTAMFRYPYYHTAEDTPDKLDFDRLARAVAGLERVLLDLANQP